MIINMDRRRNEVLMLASLIFMIGLFLYSISTNYFFGNYLIYNILCIGFWLLMYSSEDKFVATTARGKNKVRFLAVLTILFLSFFKMWVNVPLLIFGILFTLFFILRGFNILKFRRFNMETQEYEDR